MSEYRLPKFAELEVDERYEQLDQTVTRADNEGVLRQLPTSGPASSSAYPPGKMRVISNRLFLLGYLDKGDVDNKMSPAIEDAIRKFQHEAADIEKDGWVGDETWQALQELVSFEDPTNLDRWFNLGGPNPALRRAVDLRLHVLGFSPQRQHGSMVKTLASLAAFRMAARAIGLVGDHPADGFSLPSLEVLFDMDAMLEKLAGADDAFFEDGRFKGFRISVAKIELWLLGYKVIPNGSYLRNFFVLPEHWHVERPISLKKALRQFWLDNNLDKREARRRSKSFDARLFQELVESEEERENRDENQHMEMIEKELSTSKTTSQSLAEATWNEVRTLGSRMWDGIKRAFRWVVRVIRKGLQKTAQWIKGLARTLYRGAMRAFEPIKIFASGLTSSVRFFIPRQLPCSVEGHVRYVRNSNFDFINLVETDADPQIVKAANGEFQRQARLFKVSTHLMGLFLNLLITTIKRVALGGGWFGFIFALAKLRPKLKEFGDLLSLSRQLQAA